MRSNEDAAAALDEAHELWKALGDSWRARAYRDAARSVRASPVRLTPETSEAELEALPNVGPAIARKLREFLQTGRIASLEDLTRDLPRDFALFVRIRGIKPSLAARLHREHGLDTLDDLLRAADDGRLERAGLDARVVERVREEAPPLKREASRRFLLARALREAERLAERLADAPGVRAVEVAGDARRGVAALGHLDLLLVSDTTEAAIAALLADEEVRERLQAGPPARVVLAGGLDVILRVASPAEAGSALLEATGSREHLAQLERRAAARGLRLVGGALAEPDGKLTPAPTEREAYAALGLPWIPPELREGAGEIEAAERGELPDLVALHDLRGDLHMHTHATDGVASLDEMAAAAAKLGREYVAITDHAKGLAVPQGLNEATLLARREEVAARHLPLPVLVGAEVNILENGRLSLDDEALERLDVVVASVHSNLRDPRATITKRVVNAISTGLVDVLGHPTNRRLPRRPESDLDWDRVFEAAAHHRVAVEINSSPERMDLPPELARRAKEAGCRFTIDTDAHAPEELAYLRLGVLNARRAGLGRDDILTTLPFDELRGWLASR